MNLNISHKHIYEKYGVTEMTIPSLAFAKIKLNRILICFYVKDNSTYFIHKL